MAYESHPFRLYTNQECQKWQVRLFPCVVLAGSLAAGSELQDWQVHLQLF